MAIMENPKYLDLMSKYLSGNIASVERQELLSWAERSQDNKAFFDEMIQLWSLSGDFEEALPMEVDVEAAWDKLEARLDPPQESSVSPGKIVPFFYRRKTWAIAASIAAIFVVGTFFLQQFYQPTLSELVTLEQENKDILLPDGTKINLRQNSTLRYRTKFKEREVELIGEAFFDVASLEGRPFVIRSGDLETTVVGTAFNIRAYPEESNVEVVVEEGIVEVAPVQVENAANPAMDNPIRLRQKQSARYEKEAQSVEKFELTDQDLESKLVWREKVLVFKDEPLPNVAKTLEDFFDIKIEIDANKYRDCPVNFVENDPELDQVLLVLVEMQDLDIQTIEKGKTYSFKGGFCE